MLGNREQGERKVYRDSQGPCHQGLTYQERAQSTRLDTHMTHEAYDHPSEKACVCAVSRHPALAQMQTGQAHTKVCCVCVHKRADKHTSCPLRCAREWSSPQTARSPGHALTEATLGQYDMEHTRHREAHTAGAEGNVPGHTGLGTEMPTHPHTNVA